MAEQWTFNPLVPGSSPGGVTLHKPHRINVSDAHCLSGVIAIPRWYDFIYDFEDDQRVFGMRIHRAPHVYMYVSRKISAISVCFLESIWFFGSFLCAQTEDLCVQGA